MSFNILQLSIVFFHLSHCFYELTSAGLNLSLIRISCGKYYKRKVFHLNELSCDVLGCLLMKMLWNSPDNHIHKASFYRELSNVSRMMNVKQMRVNILCICMDARPCEFFNAHLMTFCMKILSCIHLFNRCM